MGTSEYRMVCAVCRVPASVCATFWRGGIADGSASVCATFWRGGIAGTSAEWVPFREKLPHALKCSGRLIHGFGWAYLVVTRGRATQRNTEFAPGQQAVRVLAACWRRVLGARCGVTEFWSSGR